MKLTRLPTLQDIIGQPVPIPTKGKRQALVPSTTQSPSTQAILDRDPAQDAIAKERSLPTFKEAGYSEPISRPLSAKEVDIEQSLRQSRNSEDASEESSVDEAKRKTAIDEYMK
jgi:hypothetical protein